MFYVAEAENEPETDLLHDFVPYMFYARCHFSSEIIHKQVIILPFYHLDKHDVYSKFTVIDRLDTFFEQ